MKTLYQCEVCGTTYEVRAAAAACEAQGVPTNIKVGDIVTKRDGYGWHNGDDAWVLHNRGMFHGQPTRDFYWLVVSIGPGNSSSNRHCNAVVCVSRGIVNGLSVDENEVWGIDSFNHYVDPAYSGISPVVAVDPPAKVREEAAAFMARGFVVGRNRDGYVSVTTKKGGV